jgi:hypothetical protein
MIRRVFVPLTTNHDFDLIPSTGAVAAFGRRGGSVEVSTTHPSACGAYPSQEGIYTTSPVRLSSLSLFPNPPFDAGQYAWHLLPHHSVIESNEANTKAFQSALSVDIPLTL